MHKNINNLYINISINSNYFIEGLYTTNCYTKWVIFGEKYNNYVKQMILISVKDAIYQKRNHGDQMLLSNVKRSLLR